MSELEHKSVLGKKFAMLDGRLPIILIVDDNETNRRMMGRSLERGFDCEIITANNGKEAVEMALKRFPDLILMDGMMPDMDGFEATLIIKENPETQDIPIIFVTALADKKQIIQAFESGASDYIVKPFYALEMMARIQTHLTVKLQKDAIKSHVAEQRRLLHVLCHDLSNPIISARNVIELSQEDPSILTELSEEIKVALNNALELIALIRQFRAIEEGKHRWDITPVPLRQAIEESCMILRNRAVHKQITLKNQVADNFIVMAERVSLINSVINNLLTNAIKFSESGSIIEILAEDKGDTVELTVRDYGIGIPASQIGSIFNLNAATSRPGTEQEQGTGFGMPLVQKFSEAYGGSVRIESKERTADSTDHGTAIIITLLKASTATTTNS